MRSSFIPVSAGRMPFFPGRQHVHQGRLRFTQQKNRRRKPVSLELPILPELQRMLDASELGELTFLVSENGRPFTVAGFGN